MEWVEIVDAGAGVVTALAISWGVFQGNRVIQKYWVTNSKRREKREQEANRLNTRHKLILNELNMLLREMEQLWLPFPAMVIDSKPEDSDALKISLRERLVNVEKYFQRTNYDFKRRLFRSIDLAFESYEDDQPGWAHELSMYAALEFLRATSHIEDEFTEEMVIQSNRFLQFQENMHRSYETNFRELSRIRRLQCANL